MFTAEEARQAYYRAIYLSTLAPPPVFSLEIYSRKDFLQNTLGSLGMVKVII